MARKPKNEDIGEIRCPFTGDLAPVRRDCNGKLYYVGKAGMIKPNMPIGQDYMLEHATIWGASGKPGQVSEPVTSTPAPAANDDSLTGSDDAPLVTKIPLIRTNVPVNESHRQKPVTGAQSKPQPQEPEKTKPQSFVSWLVG